MVIKFNYLFGKTDYLENLISLTLTSLIWVCLSLVGLYLYITFKGGMPYLAKLSQNFLFRAEPSIYKYCIGLPFEGIAFIAFTLI